MPAAHPLPTLTDNDLVLRPSRPGDEVAVNSLLQEPEVAAWWGENTEASVAEELVGAFTIEIDGTVAGILECHEELEPMYPSVAFDIALGVAWHGRGYGRRALRLAIDHFVVRGHHRFTIDPAVTNQMAIRSYQRVGFRPVGILRSCERAPDGTWRDALLMDLLRWELDEFPLHG
ncbi:MAG: GNAT family N-acetyltransferase [Solirubrobacteraceae bacterium]|nr:GNAT family N-acetyltransferase [Solirubrobacteraceae bacterium]